jgi:hypothetical protein
MRKTVLIAALLASLALLAGCPQGHKISDLERNPGRYAGKEVAVSGTVSNSFGALGTGAYEVDDGTGKIWVISTGYGVPSKGAHVTVAGGLIQGANFGGRSFGLALKETRRAH